MSSCCPPYVEDITVTSTKHIQIYEYPRFLGGTVEILFEDKDIILTTDEFNGIKKILGKDYMNVTLEEFKSAYMAEMI